MHSVMLDPRSVLRCSCKQERTWAMQQSGRCGCFHLVWSLLGRTTRYGLVAATRLGKRCSSTVGVICCMASAHRQRFAMFCTQQRQLMAVCERKGTCPLEDELHHFGSKVHHFIMTCPRQV